MIRGLLTLRKFIKQKRSKVILASNLMRIIGTYAHYLNSRWNFLKGVTIKLLDFMHGADRDAKHLAYKTFIQVVEKCKKKFIKNRPDKNAPFYNEIMKKLNDILPILEPQQVIYLYQTFGQILIAHSPEDREGIIIQRIQGFMAPQNENWKKILKQINQQSYKILHHPTFMNDIHFILCVNLSVCRGMGFKYIYQLHKIFKDILNLYYNISQTIYYEVENAKVCIIHSNLIKEMRALKRKVLVLLSVWISSAKEDQEHNRFLLGFFPYLIGRIVHDYYHCPVISLREPEVLIFLTTIINSLKGLVSEKVELFLSFILQCTAIMSQERYKFLKIRRLFLLFIHAVVRHCFGALEEMFSSLVTVKFKVILALIIWSIKQKEVEDVKLGLETLSLLLNKFHQSKMNQKFYETYYLLILEEMLFVVINHLHLSDFQVKAIILSKMLKLVAKEEIMKPLNCLVQKYNMTNDIYVQLFIASFFHREFRFLTKQQLDFLTNGFFKYHEKVQTFVDYLNNLPTLLKEFQEENVQIAAAYKKNTYIKESQKVINAQEMVMESYYLNNASFKK